MAARFILFYWRGSSFAGGLFVFCFPPVDGVGARERFFVAPIGSRGISLVFCGRGEIINPPIIPANEITAGLADHIAARRIFFFGRAPLYKNLISGAIVRAKKRKTPGT